MWISFDWGLNNPSPQSVKEHRPERSDTWQDQKPKANPGAQSFGIQALNSQAHEWHRKHQSKAGVSRHRINDRFSEGLKHLYRRPGSLIR
jgi:hypothetical protein